MRVRRTRLLFLSCLLMTAPSATTAQQVDPIILEGTVNAPLDDVWKAFSTSDGLKAWLAPHAEIDLHVGGLMRTNYNAAGSLGDPATIENTVLSFEPRRMLSIRVSKPPQNFPFPIAVRQMWTVIYFDPVGTTQTRVREVSLGFTSEPESQRMRDFFQQGNATTLSQLQRHFNR